MTEASGSDTPLKAVCHCGRISVTAPRKPKEINVCQCTVCYTHGAEWAYYQPDEVNIQHEEGAETTKYVWADRILEFHFCTYCGCMVYWWPLDLAQCDNEMGVNTRLMDRDKLRRINKKIDWEIANM